jgi:hypothetical protein
MIFSYYICCYVVCFIIFSSFTFASLYIAYVFNLFTKLLILAILCSCG